NGEHPAKLVDEVEPVVFIQVHDRLNVSASPEAMPSLLQVGTDLAKVVDLAVAECRDGLVFIAHGLLAAGRIDHREPAHAARDHRLATDAGLIPAFPRQ